MDYEHLRNELVERYSILSRRLQQITRYAMSHPNEMGMETIAVIAGRAEVPPSSMIRFAKSFGFSGFSEMQKVFQQGLVSRMSEYQKRVQNLNLVMSHLKEENKSKSWTFRSGRDTSAVKSSKYRYRRTDRKRGLDSGKIKCGTYCGTAEVFPHSRVSDLFF